MNNDRGRFDSFLEKFSSRITNIVLLGFFGTLCCLLVVPAGAGFTAVNAATRSYLLEDDRKPLKTFWNAFKEQFRLSTIVWLIHAAVIAVLWWDFAYYRAGTADIDILAQAAVFVLLIFLVMELSLVYVVISEKMADKPLDCMKLALDIGVNCFWETLMITIIMIAIPVAVFFLLRGLLFVMPGVNAYLSWQIIPRMLKKYKFKKGNEAYRKERQQKK